MYKRKLFCSFDQRQTYLAVLNWNFQQESSKNRPIAGSHSQWRIKGRGPPLFLDQTEARRAEKICFETVAPPPPHPPTYLLIWSSGSAPDSRGKSPPCWRAREALRADKQRNWFIYCKSWCEFFVFLVPVRLLFSTMAVLYHVND